MGRDVSGWSGNAVYAVRGLLLLVFVDLVKKGNSSPSKPARFRISAAVAAMQQDVLPLWGGGRRGRGARIEARQKTLEIFSKQMGQMGK